MQSGDRLYYCRCCPLPTLEIALAGRNPASLQEAAASAAVGQAFDPEVLQQDFISVCLYGKATIDTHEMHIELDRHQQDMLIPTWPAALD